MSDPGKAVFLSYASQDAEAAKRICEALRSAGVEVWFDQSELAGGDAWDQKIRGQISSCALFMPVVSANTQARREGYFRIEWKLAAQRTYAIADDEAFLLPIVIDDTRDTDAKVPAEFKAVQWTKLPLGAAPPAFVARVKRLLSGEQGAGSKEHEVGGALRPDGSEKSGRKAPPAPKQWLPRVAAGAIVAVVALLIARPWDRPAPTPPAMDAPPAQPATPAVDKLSPARELVERARGILEQSSLTRPQLDTASDLCERALRLDTTDPVVWAVAARADVLYIHPYGYDRSPERRRRAQERAERATSLAPGLFEVRVAQAMVFAHAVGTPALQAEAEKTLRELVASHPGDTKLTQQLAELLRAQGRFGDAAKVFESYGEFEVAGWSYYEGGEMRQALAVAGKAPRTVTSILLRALLEETANQDLAAAQAVIDELKPSELLAEMPACVAIRIAMNRRQPARILELAAGLSQEYLDSNSFRGPRRFFTGLAHEMAGRPAAAATEWRTALTMIEGRLKTAPDDRNLLMWSAWLHAALNDTAEAERLLARGEALAGRSSVELDEVNYLVLHRLGRKDVVLPACERLLRARPRGWQIAHAQMRFSPVVDYLLDDPRWNKLLRENLPEGAKPFADQPSAVSDQQSAPGPGPQTQDPRPQTQDPRPSNPAAPDSKSVAVLAFANLSDDKANEYFSDGISEELLNVLAKVPGLKVSARTSAFYFKGKEVPVPEIARQLGVAYVVEGSVRKQGEKVRITAQLIKAADGFHVWSDTFTRDLKDVFAVQDEIAGLIAQNLQLKLGESTRARKVVNPEAHQLVLKGRHYWSLRGGANLAIAEDAYQRALALDPDFAEAHAGMADVWTIRAWYRTMEGGGLAVAGDLARAKVAIQRATELDPGLAEPYATLGTVRHIEGKFAEAAAPFGRAFELNPNYAVGRHWYGTHLMSIGRFDASFEELRRATQLDPLAPMPLWTLAAELNILDASTEAFEAADRALRLRPGFLPLLSEKALAAWSLGRRDDALACVREIVANTSAEARWWADTDAVYVLYQAGDTDGARRLADRIFSTVSDTDYRRAFVLATLGRMDEALAWRGVIPSTAFIRLVSSPVWDPARNDPRFEAFVAAAGYAREYRSGRVTLERMRKDREGRK